MTLVNMSNKIINLGPDPVLPGETRPITKAVAELPSIKAFIGLGFVQIVDEGKTTASEKKAADKIETLAAALTPTEPTAADTASGGAGNDAPAADEKKASQTKKK